MSKPITRADLATMPAAEIVSAHQAGRLDHLLADRAPADEASVADDSREGGADLGARAGERFPMTRDGQRALLRTLSPAEIVRRQAEGHFDALLKGDLP